MAQWLQILHTKWGDIVFTLANEECSSSLEIDLRVLIDKSIQKTNIETDVSSGKFSKYDPESLKQQSDRCKLMVEAKSITNNLMSSGLQSCTIPTLQFCGTELILLVNSLVAPGLYVGNEICSFSLINTFENLKIIPHLAKSLLKFKNQCIQAGGFVVSDYLVSTERSKKSIKGPKYQTLAAQCPHH